MSQQIIALISLGKHPSSRIDGSLDGYEKQEYNTISDAMVDGWKVLSPPTVHGMQGFLWFLVRDEPTWKNPTPAADVIIENDKGQVLLIKRRDPPYGWALPGGFINEGESSEQAAVREAREETGLIVELMSLLYCYSQPDRDPRQHMLSVAFVGKIFGGELKAGDDATDAKKRASGKWSPRRSALVRSLQYWVNDPPMFRTLYPPPQGNNFRELVLLGDELQSLYQLSQTCKVIVRVCRGAIFLCHSVYVTGKPNCIIFV